MVTHPTKHSSVGLNQAIEIAQGILPREFKSWDEVPKSLLPTPLTTDYKQTDCQGNWNRNSPPLGTIVHGTDFGRYQAAIQRWESVIGRPAPAPTKPDGKDGQHRLSSLFTEWLMGVPEGWITDCGLTRNEEIKACGNGVVPQQAELALRILLEGVKY